MPTLKLPRTAGPRLAPVLRTAALLLAPAGVPALAVATGRGTLLVALWAGISICLLLFLVVNRFVAGRPFHSPLTGLTYAAAVIALWLSSPEVNDPFVLIALGGLTLVGVGLFAGYALHSSGTPTLRRARQIAKQLATRKDWPHNLDACRHLPEVKALREATRDEAAPVLTLLTESRPEVRLAALAALEFRRAWRRGQPDLLLNIVRTDPVPEIRAAAVLALGGLNQRLILEELAGCLRDPSALVRRAAADAITWNCERRWVWVRHAVHEALGDPRFARDGAIDLTVGSLSDQAAADLASWSTETGPLGIRAAQTLSLHYSRRLAESADPQLVALLIDHVLDPRGAAILRVELAHLLRQYDQLTPKLGKRLLDPANPGPIRLLAVEALLKAGPNDAAVQALRQVARQPNRELALQAAVIVQKYLHVDLGLALGQPVPALHTRQAAEVTRRVIQWAAPLGSSRLGNSAVTPSRPGVPRPTYDEDDSFLAPPAGPTKVPPLEWD